MPHESLDTRENLPRGRRRQVAFGQLQDAVPAVPNEAVRQSRRVARSLQPRSLTHFRFSRGTDPPPESPTNPTPAAKTHLVGDRAGTRLLLSEADGSRAVPGVHRMRGTGPSTPQGPV